MSTWQVQACFDEPHEPLKVLELVKLAKFFWRDGPNSLAHCCTLADGW
jgi:hypothetical protein